MSRFLMTLFCPPGAEEAPISHRQFNYEPYRRSDGRLMVDVPRHVAFGLMRVGGFLDASPKPSPEPVDYDDLVPVSRITEGGAGGVGGYEPDADGVCVIPRAMLGEVQSHGFYELDFVKRERARLKAECERRVAAVRAEYAPPSP